MTMTNDDKYLSEQLPVLNDELVKASNIDRSITKLVLKITQEIIQNRDVKAALSVIGSLPEQHELRRSKICAQDPTQ